MTQPAAASRRRWATMVAIGLIGGLLSGLFAIGGGIIMVPGGTRGLPRKRKPPPSRRGNILGCGQRHGAGGRGATGRREDQGGARCRRIHRSAHSGAEDIPTWLMDESTMHGNM